MPDPKAEIEINSATEPKASEIELRRSTAARRSTSWRNFSSLKSYVSIYRAYDPELVKSQRLTFSTLQALVKHPDRADILKRNPKMTKNQALKLAREYRKSLRHDPTPNEKLAADWVRFQKASKPLIEDFAAIGTLVGQEVILDKLIDAIAQCEKTFQPTLVPASGPKTFIAVPWPAEDATPVDDHEPDAPAAAPDNDEVSPAIPEPAVAQDKPPLVEEAEETEDEYHGGFGFDPAELLETAEDKEARRKEFFASCAIRL